MPLHLAINGSKRDVSAAMMLGIAAVAEQVDMKQVCDLRLDKTLQQWLEIADDLIRTLVADAHQDRGG